MISKEIRVGQRSAMGALPPGPRPLVPSVGAVTVNDSWILRTAWSAIHCLRFVDAVGFSVRTSLKIGIPFVSRGYCAGPCPIRCVAAAARGHARNAPSSDFITYGNIAGRSPRSRRSDGESHRDLLAGIGGVRIVTIYGGCSLAAWRRWRSHRHRLSFRVGCPVIVSHRKRH
jgi:hypothetical protein